METTPNIESLSTLEKVARAVKAIRALIAEQRPLAVAYSAGKDSSVLMALVLDAALKAKDAGENIPLIMVTHANTGIENPAYQVVAYEEIAKIKAYAERHELPLQVDITHPSLNDSWAVRILSGRALPTFANSSSRDCTINWKLNPQERQRKKVLVTLKERGKPVVLVGTRYEESQARATRMAERGEQDTDVWQEEILNGQGKIVRVEDRMSPLAYWSQEDIWVYLSDLVHGRRVSYTDAVAVWEAYQDGGNSSCAVVGDDAMKTSAKACGARFGCALCTAVGRDKSLENMIEADPKYAYMRNLNRLQRFLVDTQYDQDRRNWLGRTIKNGYIAIGPDTYSSAMLSELLYYALSIDLEEARAARRLWIAPRFQLVSVKALIAIDAIWSAQAIFPRPFEAIRIYFDVMEGNLKFPPEEVGVIEKKSFPATKKLYVGQSWDNENNLGDYTGLRSVEADLVAANETGCIGHRDLPNGRVVMDMQASELFDVDEEGAFDFLQFEAELKIEETEHTTDATSGYRYYVMLGLLSTGSRHVGIIDEMMRRSHWKQRNGLVGAPKEVLLQRVALQEGLCATESSGIEVKHQVPSAEVKRRLYQQMELCLDAA